MSKYSVGEVVEIKDDCGVWHKETVLSQNSYRPPDMEYVLDAYTEDGDYVFCSEKDLRKIQTRYEKIMAEMTVKRMAEYRTKKIEGQGLFQEQWFWENDAGSWRDDAQGLRQAIQAEIEYLNGVDDE